MSISSRQVRCAALSALILLLAACAREPQHREPQLGEVFSIAPVAINYQLAPSLPSTKALKFNVMWGGRAINLDKGDTTINLYGKNNSLIASKKWSELAESHRTTSCSNQQSATLDGYLMGVALICDGSLQMEKIQKIEAINEKGERRSSTSWGVYRITDEVNGVSIGFY